MPRPFHALSPHEFQQLLEAYPFTRRISEVHMHHTWRPNHDQDRGRDSVEAMWRFHTRELGWSDIAQHLTIDKRGVLWTGRHWNVPPASASGYNGNRVAGPFMFEMIGDFDRGRDEFEGAQREATLRVIALVQRHFGLPPEALRFHNEMSAKTCPGTSIDKAETVAAVRAVHATLAKEAEEAAAQALLDHVDPAQPVEPFGPDMLYVKEIIAGLPAPVTRARGAVRSDEERNGPDPASAELPDAYTTRQIILLTGGTVEEARPFAVGSASQDGSDSEARGGGSSLSLTPSMKRFLRPYVVNLERGRFSSSGAYQTRPEHIAAMFDTHLPQALTAAREAGLPLHIVFYAHGGLVNEHDGLAGAHQHVTWWTKSANVYPIYFVWETGLLRALAQAAKDVFSFRGSRGDRLDGAIEWMLRRGDIGKRVWDAMKDSAQLASIPEEHGGGGGAYVVADRLGRFVADYHQAFKKREIRLHAVGHSAGAVFHNYFVPRALARGAKRFETVQFMAPALRVDAFKDGLDGTLGDADGTGRTVDALTLYTMFEEEERADNCLKVYQKSLLYLIRQALEEEKGAEILGLEESLRRDRYLRTRFGLDGQRSPVAEVVFSPTNLDRGRSATQAVTHGGFDNDPATMQSLYHRITGGPPSHDFPEEARDAARSAPTPESFDPRAFPELALHASRPPQGAPALRSSREETPPASAASMTGRRLALCVGINAYPEAPLLGCVNDARAWARFFRRRGFETTLLTDAQATYTGLVEALTTLVRAGQPGDVLAFQFSGHGTFFLDLDGDERTGEDQALCPFDSAQGATLLDDEVREIYAQVASGVNLTSFLDCCHSGSATRFAGPQTRARSIEPNDAMRAFRTERLQTLRRSYGARSAAQARDIAFAAAQPQQLAFETRGIGDFTRRALALLDGDEAFTNVGFHEAVVAAFGINSRQTPYLDAPTWAQDQRLLAPIASPEPLRAIGTVHAATVHAASAPSDDLSHRVDMLSDRVDALTQRMDALLDRL